MRGPVAAALCALLWASACTGGGPAGGATATRQAGEGSDPTPVLRAPRLEGPGVAGPSTTDTALPATGDLLPVPERPEDPSPPRSVARAGAGAGGNADCHPSYHPCLPDLPGDALDCADLAEELKPVVVWDAANDPYRLGERSGWLACTGIESAAEPAAEVAGVAQPVPEPDPVPEPLVPHNGAGDGPPVGLPEPAPVDPPAAAGPPGPDPPAATPSPQPAARPGEPSEPSEPEGSEPEPAGPAEPPQFEPPPPGPLEPPDEPNTAEFCNPGAAAGEEQWCLPETPEDADVVRLFWCDEDPHASPHVEVYVDTDVTLKYRTRALTLAVGTRFERYSTCYGVNAVEVVTRIGRIDVPGSDDPLVGVQMCGRFYLGAELYSWGEVVYTAWQDPDGRFRLDMPNPVEFVGPC